VQLFDPEELIEYRLDEDGGIEENSLVVPDRGHAAPERLAGKIAEELFA
jgi:hypothetical protein